MEEVIIQLDQALEGFVEEWLWIQDALSVALQPPHVAERSLTALFDRVEPDAFRQALATATADFAGKIHGVRFQTVDEQAWQVHWRESFKPFRIGRFRVVGEWEAIAEDPQTLRVYPGQAFGTGQHETTRLMIEHMETLDLQGKRVLDVGCGMGMLSMVAERLGAAEVFGFDADPDCEENMHRHQAINRTRRVTLKIGKLEDFALEPFDLILANITLNVLHGVWPRLATLLKPGGRLLNSGMLESQREDAVRSLVACGFQVSEILTKGAWLLVEARLR